MQHDKSTKNLSLQAPLNIRSRQAARLTAQHNRLPRCARNISASMYSIKNQHGVSIVAAIFLITALALLATAAIQLVTTGQQSISQEITSVKAYFAAQTGAQWGMYQAVYASTPSGTHTMTLSNSGLSNTTVSVALASNTIDSNVYYQITANAEYATTTAPEYSSRQIRVRFKP